MTQPWASLVAYGVKTVETRSWGTSYRGPLLIHAAKKPATKTQLRELTSHPCYRDASALQSGTNTDVFVGPRGAVVAVVYLDDCVRTEVACQDWGMSGCERVFGDYRPGRYAWRLKLLCRLQTPVEVRGRLGLWKSSPTLLGALAGQIVTVPWADGVPKHLEIE